MFPIVPVGEEPASLPAFIIGRNGIYLRKESALGITTTRVNKIAHLAEVSPALDYKLPKIPASLSEQIAGFLLKVDKVHHTEGAVLLCLDEQRNWQIVIPRQDISGFDVKYFVDPDTVPEGWLLAGTVHSHPFNKSSAPIPSFTDEEDERKMDGVHFVAGSLEKDPQYAAAVVVDGTRFKYADWTDLMEPAEPNLEAVPDEWLTKCEGKKPSVVGAVVGKVTSWGTGSGYSYQSGPTIREGETPEEALARYDKGSLGYLVEDAAKLGYKFTWKLEPRVEGEPVSVEVKDTYDPTPKYDTVKIGFKPPNGGAAEQMVIPVPVVPKSNEAGTIWKDAEMIECEGKHPYSDCPKACGCHCKPCREHTVGSFAPVAKGTALRHYASQIECECKTCYGGCYMTVHLDDVEDGTDPICGLCEGGSHYTKAEEVGALTDHI